MKKKIVGICVCMLVLATAFPAVMSVKNNAISGLISSPSVSSMAEMWTEEQKLLAADGATLDSFGWSVALSGDTVLIGADQNDDNGQASGSVYVFTLTGTTWTQQALLLPLDGAAGDRFGYAVALAGDTAFIGAVMDENQTGAVYVFNRTGTTWIQQQKLTAPDGAVGDDFGVSISPSGDTVLIGANWNDDNGEKSGSAYVFIRNGTIWTYQALLLPSDGVADDRFGYAISLSGDTALIGAWNDDSAKGSAYIFTRSGTTWTEQQKLYAPDGEAGDNFGIAVALDGNTALIGAQYDSENGANSGSVFVFINSGTNWIQQAKLLAKDGAAMDIFGCPVFLDGDTALIGAAYDDDTGANSGSAYIFTRTGTTWTQQAKLLASDGHSGNQFSLNGIFLEGDTAVIGAPFGYNNTLRTGSAYIFTKVGLTININGGLGVTLKIKNNGVVKANDVPWRLHVEGGILRLINKTMNGTVNITAGETIPVATIKLFGFGRITITAKVAEEEQIMTGTQILVFSIVKT